MIFKNTSIDEMTQALNRINEKYAGNIRFKSILPLSSRRIRATLTVNSTNYGCKGYRRGYQWQKVAAACWHVHGDFFDALIDICPDVIIETALTGKKIITKDGGNWQDAQVGSWMMPQMLSAMCDCER